MSRALGLVASLGLLVASSAGLAADNELSETEKTEGWALLFNGKDHSGWKCSNGKPVASKIEDNALIAHKAGGYLVVHEKQFGDFILRCDVKLSKGANSGIFIRVGDLADPVQTGLEIQLIDTTGRGYHDFGAICDLVKPESNAQKPIGEWNAFEITCKGPLITVNINGENVAIMNCDSFKVPGRRFDGTENKFTRAIKDFPRSGYLGFQDHDGMVWFKNIRIKDMSASVEEELKSIAEGLQSGNPNEALNAERQLVELAKKPERVKQMAEIVKKRLASKDDPATFAQKVVVAVGAQLIGEIDLAIEFNELCIKERPNDPLAYRRIGAVLASSGRFEDAVKACDRGIAQRPDYFDFYQLKAACLEKLGKTTEAFDVIQAAAKNAESEEDKRKSITLLIGILENSKKTQLALDLCEQAIDEYAGTDFGYLLTLRAAQINTKLGKSDKSEKLLLSLIESPPGTVPDRVLATANNDLGYTWADANKNLDRAEAMIKKALEVEPDNGAYLDSMGWVLYRKGNFAEAVEYLARATQDTESGGDAVIFDHLGDAYDKLKKPAEAKAAWKKALETAEGDEKAKIEAKLKAADAQK